MTALSSAPPLPAFSIEAETPADVPAREALLDRAMGPGHRRKSSEKLRRGRVPAEGLAFVARDAAGALVGTVRLWEVAVERGSSSPQEGGSASAEPGEGAMPKYRVSNFKRTQAQSLRHSLTSAEHRLWQLLRSRQLSGIKFRRQVPLGPWIADFVSFEEMLIVEADGGQHADCQRDQVRDADLQRRGFRILRFWNNDIIGNASGVIEKIVETIEHPPSPRGLRPRPSPTRGEG